MTVRAEEAIPNSKLRSLRLERAWSLQDVADGLARIAREESRHIAISADTVGRWERGNIRRPDPSNIRLLATLFGVTPAEVGYGAGEDTGTNVPPHASTDVEASQASWLAVRKVLKERRGELRQRALNLYRADQRLGSTGLLAPAAWRPATPLPLSAIRLRWDDSVKPLVTGREEESRPLRPLQAPTRRYERYHKAIRDLDRPRLYENRLCYRLVAADLTAAEPTMTFGNMCYFDMIDVGEAAAHELALNMLSIHGRGPARWEHLPFRRMVRDPFEVGAYPLLLSISTLTIRHSRSGSSFLLLERDAKKVAIAGGMLSVLPTGVFQPASILPVEESPDFDLWRNMMREYSEEFLGNPEHDGNGPPVDYENEEPFRSLDHAYRNGRIRIHCLGIGVDSLNLVSDVLTVAVYEADVFDALFRDRVSDNDEGSVSNGGDTHFYDFDEATVARLLRSAPLASSGAACLDLAWQHRADILGMD